MLTAFYNVRYLNWGFNQNISYKINTSNSKDYRFGNRISGNSNVFYIQQIQKNLALMPYTGLYYEHSGQDFRNKEQIRETGSYFTAANVGVDVYIAQRVTVGGNYQIPISQNLGNGELRAQERLNVQFSVLF